VWFDISDKEEAKNPQSRFWLYLNPSCLQLPRHGTKGLIALFGATINTHGTPAFFLSFPTLPPISNFELFGFVQHLSTDSCTYTHHPSNQPLLTTNLFPPHLPYFGDLILPHHQY